MNILNRSITDCKSIGWSGGTSTELLIWPPETSYAERDFLFRISSATVESEESIFTLLPGIVRWITPLSGGFTLSHTLHHNIKLQPFEIDRFYGGWETLCLGKGTDFNLMLNRCGGTLQCFRGEQELIVKGAAALCFYFPQGGTLLQMNTLYTARRNDLWAFFISPNETLHMLVNAQVILYAHVDITKPYHRFLEEP